MNAKEFLEQQAAKYKLTMIESFHGDFDLRPDPSVSGTDLLQFCAVMDEVGYVCNFKRHNTILIKAPHNKAHDWDSTRGWGCTHGLTAKGCEVFKAPVIGSVV